MVHVDHPPDLPPEQLRDDLARLGVTRRERHRRIPEERHDRQRLVTAMNAVGRNLAVVVDQGVKENKFQA